VNASKPVGQGPARATIYALVVTLVTAIGAIACSTGRHQPPSVTTAPRTEVGSSDSQPSSSELRFTADQIEMLKDGDALLLGHVTLQYPSGKAIHLSGDKVTYKDGPVVWEGHVRIQLGEHVVTGEKAMVTTGTANTLISMDQAHLTRL
jgi:lipopolysaccharide assembly outer membrane protein LptD (OstA)